MCKRTFGLKMGFWGNGHAKGLFGKNWGLGKWIYKRTFVLNGDFRGNEHAKEHLG